MCGKVCISARQTHVTSRPNNWQGKCFSVRQKTVPNCLKSYQLNIQIKKREVSADSAETFAADNASLVDIDFAMLQPYESFEQTLYYYRSRHKSHVTTALVGRRRPFLRRLTQSVLQWKQPMTSVFLWLTLSWLDSFICTGWYQFFVVLFCFFFSFFFCAAKPHPEKNKTKQKNTKKKQFSETTSRESEQTSHINRSVLSF